MIYLSPYLLISQLFAVLVMAVCYFILVDRIKLPQRRNKLGRFMKKNV